MAELGLLYCAVIWGATFYLVKDAIAGIDPLALVAQRFFIAAACLLPWVWRRGKPLRHLREGAALALLLAALYISQTIGLGITTASNSGFITGLFIFFTPLFLFLWKRRWPTRAEAIALVVAMVGLRLLTGGLSGFNRGDAMTLIAAATYAAHLLATDHFVRKDSDHVLLVFHQFWITGALAGIWALAAGRPLFAATRHTNLIVWFLALFPTLSGFFVQMRAQKTVEPIRTSLIFTMEPVCAAVFAWTLGHEPFVWTRALGGALIVSAMLASEWWSAAVSRPLPAN